MPRRSASLSKSATMRCQTRRRWYSNNRRLQVWGEARMSCGRSSQRHPVCKTYKIPLSTSRSSSRGRPVRAGRGTRRLIRSHWASVTSERYGLRGMPSNVARHEFRQQLPFCNPENRTSLGVFGVLRQPPILECISRLPQELRLIVKLSLHQEISGQLLRSNNRIAGQLHEYTPLFTTVPPTTPLLLSDQQCQTLR